MLSPGSSFSLLFVEGVNFHLPFGVILALAMTDFCIRVCLGCLRFIFAFDLGFDSALVHDSLHFAATDFYSVIV
jgi:hypothetical protein